MEIRTVAFTPIKGADTKMFAPSWVQHQAQHHHQHHHRQLHDFGNTGYDTPPPSASDHRRQSIAFSHDQWDACLGPPLDGPPSDAFLQDSVDQALFRPAAHDPYVLSMTDSNDSVNHPGFDDLHDHHPFSEPESQWSPTQPSPAALPSPSSPPCGDCPASAWRPVQDVSPLARSQQILTPDESVVWSQPDSSFDTTSFSFHGSTYSTPFDTQVSSAHYHQTNCSTDNLPTAPTLPSQPATAGEPGHPGQRDCPSRRYLYKEEPLSPVGFTSSSLRAQDKSILGGTCPPATINPRKSRLRAARRRVRGNKDRYRRKGCPKDDFYQDDKGFWYPQDDGVSKPLVKIDGSWNLSPPRERFECRHPGCARFFNRKEHLARHRFMHTGDKPHGCIAIIQQDGGEAGFCPFVCSRKDNLQDHMRNHLVKQYKFNKSDLAEWAPVERNAFDTWVKEGWTEAEVKNKLRQIKRAVDRKLAEAWESDLDRDRKLDMVGNFPCLEDEPEFRPCHATLRYTKRESGCGWPDEAT